MRVMVRATWALALAALGATAQETTSTTAAGAAGDSATAQLEKIAVTARRRDEPLQDVPLSISVQDAAELQSRGAEDISALGAATPNLTIYRARAFNGTVTAYIRGIGQFDPVWGDEPGVAIYVDDVYFARPQGALLDILDIERVEVLRGPQGTLYGKNAIGGAIKVITTPLDDAYSGSVTLTAGDYSRLDAKAIVNIPLSEQWRMRVALGSFNRDGFGKNLVTGKDVSARDATVARITSEWLPNDDINVRLAYDNYRDRSGVIGDKRLAVNRFDPLHTPPNNNNYDVQSDTPDVDKLDDEGASATVDWKLDDHLRLKSITAYRDGKSTSLLDFDTLPLPIQKLDRRFNDSQTSQEFQLLWDGDRDQVVSGLYYFDGPAGGTGNVSTFGKTFQSTYGVVRTRSAALYGDLTHEFTEKLGVEVGLRYTSERKTATIVNQDYADAAYTLPLGAANTDLTDSKTFSAWSPRISLSYKPSDSAMLYAQASRGFKGGSYNIRANTAAFPESGHPLDQESATSLEIGAKTQWAGGRYTLNAAIFNTKYNNIQLSVNTPYDSNGDGIDDRNFVDFKNAGSGTIRGAELELSARTGSYLTWLGHVGYLDTRYDKFISAGVDISRDQRFTNAPRWTAGASAVVDIPLPSGSLSARIDGNYQSKVYPTTDLNEQIAQDGYTLWNASLTWRSPGQDWQVELIGHNLSDKAYRTTGFALPTFGILTAEYGPPRTLALAATYFF
ncbi:MAG TPA: TonB-dependent receptor [Rudaea sp.]|uniref:TonB-dependent receptor n=1 Tax=Rudaea sp. TaxID=2136325 RepID=UPI002F955BC8